jgi:hypothetical protein
VCVIVTRCCRRGDALTASSLVNSLCTRCRTIIFIIVMYLCFSTVYERKDMNVRMVVSPATIRHCIEDSSLVSCRFRDDLWKSTSNSWTRQLHGWRRRWCDMIWYALPNVHTFPKRVCAIIHSLSPSMSSKWLFIDSNLSTSGSTTDQNHLPDFASITALVIARWQLPQFEVD